jgi:hypothetical protein
MTYPITPSPAVHNLPAALAKQNKAMSTQALQAFGQQLIQSILAAIWGLLTGGPPQPVPGTTSQQATANVTNWFSTVYGQATNAMSHLTMMMNQIEGTIITDLTSWMDALLGIPSTAVDQHDGTATPLNSNTTITNNSDGTATLLNQLGLGWLNTLFDNGDGTVTSPAATINNNSSQSGITALTALPAAGGLQAHMDNTVTQLFGIPPQTGQTHVQASAALGSTYNTLTSVANSVQALQTQLAAGSGGGASYPVQFNTFPNGAFPSVFTLTYTGGGTGFLEILNSNAHWVKVGNGDRSVFGYYNAGVTYGDYQHFRGAITTIPGVGAKNAAVLRCNAAQTTYVYGEIFLDNNYNLTFELGCFVGGVHTILQQGPAPLAFDFEMYAGVGGNLDRYQGYAGGTLVFDYTDSTHVFSSSIGSSNRGWGFISTTANFGQNPPADASYAVCSDNDPSMAVGSGFNAYRSSTGSFASSGLAANTSYLFPTGMFDTVSKKTADITGNGDQITVTKAGWYDMTVQVEMFNFSASLGMITIVGSVIHNTVLEKLIPGNGVAFNIAGAQDFTPWFGGTTSVYCNVNDTLSPGYYLGGAGTASNLTFTGDGTGINTYWGARLTNRSLT